MKVTAENNEIRISISEDAIDISDIQYLLDFIRVKEITSKSTAAESDVEWIANEINKDWFNKNNV